MSEVVEPLDLSSCDREPIHQLGAIQPMGFLIAVTTDWTIVRVSSNVESHVGRSPDDLLGLPLSAIVEREALHELRNRLFRLYGNDAVERLFSVALLADRREQRFDCAIHESTGLIVIEAEPSDQREPGEVAGLVRSMIGRLDAADDVDRFLHQGARQIHGLTGFDRVMVYRFHGDGSGEVVAEVARSGIAPLLGLRYPASDIPQQARALYLRTPFRIICNIDAEHASILSAPDEAGRPLDLSLSILRAVSPVHIVYLRNMGVVASLSVSIIVDGRLWGLFACHHYAPRCPSFEMRTLAELFGQMFAMRLESRERRAASDGQARARQIADRLVATVAGDIGLLNDPDWLMKTIGGILPCDGIGISLKGHIACSGVSAPAEFLPAVALRLSEIAPGQVYVTDHLKGAVPEAGSVVDGPAGMLAIPISAEPTDYVMLFRGERVQLATWAGNPHKPVANGTTAETLTPRASFAAWREEVRGRSEPFTPAEQAVAETLRISLIDIVLRLAGAAVAERQRASQRQEVLIAELNHRVRNILALINGLIRRSGDPSIGVREYMDLLEGRVLALARAHDQITQDNWGPAPLRLLFEAESGQHLATGRVTLADVPVLLEPVAFSTVSLVAHELMTNAVKHGALSGDGRIEVDWTFDDRGDLRLLWTERDGPAVAMPQRHSLGTTIIERSIPHDLGGLAKTSYEVAGFRAEFVIPARHVRAANAAEPAHQALPMVPESDAGEDATRIDGTVLLVEDSVLIAIHVQDMLAQLGVAKVATAATVAAALAEIQRARPAFAILDFNLGDENSFRVAEALRLGGIPYIFATGYGDQLVLPPNHSGVHVLQKPYTKANLAAALSRRART